MKKVLTFVFAAGMLLGSGFVAQGSEQYEECHSVYISCGYEALACGDSGQEVADMIDEWEDILCEEGGN